MHDASERVNKGRRAADTNEEEEQDEDDDDETTGRKTSSNGTDNQSDIDMMFSVVSSFESSSLSVSLSMADLLMLFAWRKPGGGRMDFRVPISGILSEASFVVDTNLVDGQTLVSPQDKTRLSSVRPRSW